MPGLRTHFLIDFTFNEIGERCIIVQHSLCRGWAQLTNRTMFNRGQLHHPYIRMHRKQSTLVWYSKYGHKHALLRHTFWCCARYKEWRCLLLLQFTHGPLVVGGSLTQYDSSTYTLSDLIFRRTKSWADKNFQWTKFSAACKIFGTFVHPNFQSIWGICKVKIILIKLFVFHSGEHQPINHTTMSSFKHGVCGCTDNGALCMCTWCVPCALPYLTGKTAESVGKSCLLYGILSITPLRY